MQSVLFPLLHPSGLLVIEPSSLYGEIGEGVF